MCCKRLKCLIIEYSEIESGSAALSKCTHSACGPQVDYVQARDCQCQNATSCSGLPAPFPCYPQLAPNPQRFYDFSGPLAVCPPMWYRDMTGACTACGLGKFSTSLNSVTCSNCQFGTYSIPPQTTVGCLACPTSVSMDQRINIICSLRATTTNARTTAPRTTAPQSQLAGQGTSKFMTTTAAVACGDGIVTYLPGDLPVGMVPEQCDPGSRLRFANLSSFISIYDSSMVPYLPEFSSAFRVCSAECQLELQYCGDKNIFQQPSPIYMLSNCLRYPLTTGSIEIVCTDGFSTANGTVIYSEECDDGNAVNGDGCSSQCKLERLFVCVVKDDFDTCSFVCGNGQLNTEAGEQCDDGNLFDGDGCNSKCEIECGFTCRNFDPDSPSLCSTVCGDGLVASLEACDIALVPANADNPRGLGCSKTCQLQNGWKCSFAAKCYETTNRTQTQYCYPACGDSMIIPPEECDDGDWNLADKACLPNCRYNRGRVCYGAECLLPVPSSSPLTLPLMSALLNGDGVSEGVFFEYAPSAPSENIIKSLALLVNRSSNIPFMFPAVSVIRSSMQDAVEASLLLTCPICAQYVSTAWKALSGTIHEEWKSLSNNVSCAYHFRPDDITTVMNLTVSQITISSENCVNCFYVEFTTSIYNSPGKLVRRFNRTSSGPIRLYLYAPADIFVFGTEQNSAYGNVGVSFQLSIDFQAITKVSSTELACLASCVWSTTCAENCLAVPTFALNNIPGFHSQRGPSGLNLDFLYSSKSVKKFKVLASSNTDDESNIGRILAIGFEPTRDPFPHIDFPCQFSQFPSSSGSLLLPVVTQQSFFTDPWFEGSWQGTCSGSVLSKQSCKIIVNIAGDTIIKHAWNCPLSGYAIGRIINMDTVPINAIDDLFLPVYYKRAVLEWTSSSIIGDVVDRTYLSLFNLGYSSSSSQQSQKVFQILLEGAIHTDLQYPRFLQGGVFAAEDDCRLLDLKPSEKVFNLSLPSLSLARNNDEQNFVSCNQSMSRAVSALQSRSDCLTLIRAFWFRDFWSPIDLGISVLNASYDFELVQDYACKSQCLILFRSELSAAVKSCTLNWNTNWYDWNIGSRVFKLLISALSALYWTAIICPSNQNGMGCASALLPLGKYFYGQGCQNLLPQSLYGPSFIQIQGSCQNGCVPNMEDYVNKMGCCSALVDQEGNNWLSGLRNDLVGWLSIDFGDRTNPFDIDFSANTTDPVKIYFENGIRLGLLSGSSKLSLSATATKSISLHDSLLTYCGLDCFWPQSVCCNALTCTNGNKPYGGACVCICPDGYSGAKCDIQGYFVQLTLGFSGQTTFSYCDQTHLTTFLAQKTGLDKTMLDFVPLSSVSRRQQSMSVLIRLRQSSCDDANRLTQKLSSFFSIDTSQAFNSVNLSSPSIKSIFTYCSGIKTVCGWSGNGKVDVAVVTTACNKALGNNSIISPNALSTDSAQQVSWVIPVAATIGFLVILFLGGLIAIFRSRIFGWFRICIQTRQHSHKKIRSSLVDTQTVQSTEIVFAKFSAGCDPKGVLISNRCDIDEVNIVNYQNNYKSPTTANESYDNMHDSSSQSHADGTDIGLAPTRKLLNSSPVSPEHLGLSTHSENGILAAPLYISSSAPANESVSVRTAQRARDRNGPVWSVFNSD